MKTKQEPNSTRIDPRFQPVVDAFARQRDVTVGKMMSSYGLKVNGKIFAMFGRGQRVAKLPLVNTGAGKRFDPGHGRRMKEWLVAVDERLDWTELAREAYQFVKT